MQHLQPGTLLQNGKYRIIQVMSEGPLSIIYLAKHILLERRVVIKEFFIRGLCVRGENTNWIGVGLNKDIELVSTDLKLNTVDLYYSLKERFKKRNRAFSSLNHPNLVKVYDLFEENNTSYAVMEYIDGISLDDKLGDHGVLPENEAIKYIAQVGDTVAYLHSHDINHFDINPSNILIRKQDNVPFLMGFGFSIQFNRTGERNRTNPDICALDILSYGGVVEFDVEMDPPKRWYDQYIPLENNSDFSPQSDVYSLAAVTYRVILGNTPPSSVSLIEEELPEFPPEISAHVGYAIRQGMQLKRSSRPASVREFLNLLLRK